MKLDLSKKETKLMLEMLSMVGYMLGDISQGLLAKSEEMHELIQKTYSKAVEDDNMEDYFEKNEEVDMLFPGEKIMVAGDDSPIEMLHIFTESTSFESIAQKLAIRDTLKQIGFAGEEFNPEELPEELLEEFFVSFPKKQEEYLEEFSENGFKT